MNESVTRATGILIIEAVNSNPNGDPDRESDPRQRPNGHGEISPVSFKRKLRDLVEDVDGPVFSTIADELGIDSQSFRILESRGRDRKTIQAEMSDDLTKFEQPKFLESTFVRKYWDARLFGNTFLEEKAHKGYIKSGVAQFVMGLSVAPVQIVRHTNTNKSGVQEGKNQGMAPLAYRVVEHGVYVMPFYVNPSHAHKSGCQPIDVELMKRLIPYAYDHTRSAVRPDVRLRHAWYIEHKNSLGSCPDHLLVEALTPRRGGDVPNEPSTSWSDYDVPKGLSDELLSRVDSCVDLINE